VKAKEAIITTANNNGKIALRFVVDKITEVYKQLSQYGIASGTRWVRPSTKATYNNLLIQTYRSIIKKN
jgi:hypothetical protein